MYAQNKQTNRRNTFGAPALYNFLKLSLCASHKPGN